MDTKEKVINASIKKIANRLAKLETLIFEDHISSILATRKKIADIFSEHKADNATLLKLLPPLIEEDKRLMAMLEKQNKNSLKWMNEKAQLNVEHGNLVSELFYHNRRKFI